jgi:chromosome segregation ATPase
MATAVSAGIQEITRRVQEERDALRISIDELTRQLSQERSARVGLDHELQAKELEILHEQQRARQAKQALTEKVMQLEKELDDEKGRHQMALMGRNVAADKNASLAAELRDAEAKWKKEIAKKDTLAAELEQAREEIQIVLLERDTIIQRTEADAKRVRELWDQILREHETQNETLRLELDASEHAREEAEQHATELQTKIEQLETRVETVEKEKKALEETIAASSYEKQLLRSQYDQRRDRDRSADDHKSRLRLQLQDLRSRCVVLEEREKISIREKEIAQQETRRAEAELAARNEELLALQTEFSDLLDKHERYAEEFKQKTRQRDVAAKLQLERLEKGRQLTDQLAGLRKREIAEYKHVLRAVNRRINEVREKQQANGAPQTINEIRVQPPKSLNIHRH